uniref:Uncharacterized protein n=1 Tax=Utricularia reniformis TaxID=192314 RepID=A0A1Y0B054_9LAMI|nr:hypothetical protein AEK19_MT0494 [Utricularia reniformis]ART30751.1 hypothetical protein AEK19_MT0494 [Utricularia reniformis]
MYHRQCFGNRQKARQLWSRAVQPRLPGIPSTYGGRRFSHIEALCLPSGVSRLTRVPGSEMIAHPSTSQGVRLPLSHSYTFQERQARWVPTNLGQLAS